LTKIDDVLFDLSRTVAAHYRSIAPFQYNKETYHLTDNYSEVPYTKCAVCGEYPIFEVSVISSDSGNKTLRIDNKCIDRLTGQNLSEWSRNNRIKRQNIIANRKYIDALSLIIEARNSKDPAHQLTNEDAEKLTIILEQLYKGLNLTTTQQQVADFYISK
jgi:hypothetical protein